MAGRPPCSGPRTLLVGLDGASPEVLEGILEAGDVPALRSVFDRGVVGPLGSQLPPSTASVWSSLYTGVNPGKHGVFGPSAFDGYDWEVVDRTDLREHALWELLDGTGLSGVVVNVPVTHPPRGFDGAIVPGWLSSDPPECHPPNVLHHVTEATGEYRIYPDLTADASAEGRIGEYRDLVSMRGRAFRYLADRFDPDLGVLHFGSTASVSQDLPGNDGAVRAVYRAVDREVGRVLDRYEVDAILVASAHGRPASRSQGFRLNEFLREEGYVETVRGGDRVPPRSPVGPDGFRGGRRSLTERVGRRLAALAGRIAGAGPWAVTLPGRPGPEELLARYLPTKSVRRVPERVDFARSRAYVRPGRELGVRVNLAGRDPEGVVSRDEYEAVRSDLIGLLEGVRTPDGGPLFEAVLPREAVFEGPYLDDGPDVVVFPASDYLPIPGLGAGEFGATADHFVPDGTGLLAAAGEAVDPTASLDDAHLIDVAPTVLATLGLAASGRMDGRSLPVVDPSGRHLSSSDVEDSTV